MEDPPLDGYGSRSGRSRPGVRILFVGDSAIHALVKAALRNDGLQCDSVAVSTLENAANALRSADWSAVLSEAVVGRHSGLDVLELVRAESPSVPFILLARTSEDSGLEAVRRGAADYVMTDRLARLGAVLRREITASEIRRERDNLIRSERTGRQILDDADLAVADIGFDGRLLSVSSRFARMLGYEEQELTGLAFEQLTVPGQISPLPDMFSAIRSGSISPVACDLRLFRRDGSLIWVRLSLSPVRDGKETVTHAIGIFQDITHWKETENELRRRTIQQSAMASLGHILLSGSSVEFILDQTVSSLATILDATLIGILQYREEGFRLVAGFGYEAVEGQKENSREADGQAALTVSSAHAIVASNIHTDGRFEPAARLLREGIVSSVTVPIHSDDGSIWGVLGAHTRTSRTFAADEIEFLRSVAAVVGQAIDRSKSDEEVRSRVRRQSAIAVLGRLALTSADEHVFERACELLMFGISADFAFAAELTDAGRLRVRGRSRCGDDLPVEIAADSSTEEGHAVLSGHLVLVDDYGSEEHSAGRSPLASGEIASSAVVPLVARSRILGTLSAYSREPNHFGPEEVDFIQTVANMLAEAVDRERGRIAIKHSELRYRRIFDGASEIIFSVDISGRLTTLNPAFETVTGWSRHTWAGARFSDIVIPEDRLRAETLLQEIVTSQSSVGSELTIDARGRRVILDVTLFPDVEKGEVVEVYGFARDITEARRALEERERVTRSLQLLLESTLEGIFTLDLEGRCTMINRAAAAFLGRSPEELIGEKFHDLVHSRDREGTPVSQEDCTIAEVLRKGEPRAAANDHFVRKDGTLIPVVYSAAPIIDAGGHVGAVVTFTDLTERRKLEAKLEQVTRLSSLGRLAATIAHEFNNVLMGIAPFVEVIRRAPPPQKVSSALDHIMASVRRGRGITQDILRFTQPAEPTRTAVEVKSWIDGVAAEARSLLPPNITFEVEADTLHIEADPNQLRQIFTNLILNARDAMPEGGSIFLSARREPADRVFPFGAIDDPSRFAHFTFIDTGSGMSPETLDQAFEPLFTTKRHGTGLGLAVTHQVVRQHGGEIFAESIPGTGTTFHIFMPLASSLHESQGTDASNGTLVPTPSQILLVEDDLTVAAGLKTILELQGFSVITARTGEEAVNLVRANPPEAVVLDMELPDMDGRSVFAAVTAIDPSLPVIFSTARADRKTLDQLLTRPNVTYLVKPYESEALIEKLSQVIEKD